jgi:predicted ABC-type ATPase
MNTLFLFRGKAATGKTTITNLLSRELNVSVLRKDDIYDEFSKYNLEYSQKNEASYDILAKLIQTNIDNNCDLIIDIGLSHNPYLEQFLLKINLKKSRLLKFICVCSNEKEWEERIRKRLSIPHPNQLFKSVKEAKDYYTKQISTPLENETVLNSSDDIEVIIKKILK